MNYKSHRIGLNSVELFVKVKTYLLSRPLENKALFILLKATAIKFEMFTNTKTRAVEYFLY